MIRKRLRNLGIVLGVLLLYYIITQILGFGIPCVFHLITGLSCPGCGVSRMLIALMHLDLRSAFQANRLLFCLLPVFTVLLVYWTLQYLTGRKPGKQAVLIERWVYIILIVLLVLWGIFRNLYNM